MKNKQDICRKCRKPIEKDGNNSWPFCSSRCKLLDLGCWATSSYRIAGDPVSDISDLENVQGEEDLNVEG